MSDMRLHLMGHPEPLAVVRMLADQLPPATWLAF